MVPKLKLLAMPASIRDSPGRSRPTRQSAGEGREAAPPLRKNLSGSEPFADLGGSTEMHKVMTAGDHVRHIRGGSVMLVERVARPADDSGTAWTCWRDGGEIKCAAYPVADLVQVP